MFLQFNNLCAGHHRQCEDLPHMRSLACDPQVVEAIKTTWKLAINRPQEVHVIFIQNKRIHLSYQAPRTQQSSQQPSFQMARASFNPSWILASSEFRILSSVSTCVRLEKIARSAWVGLQVPRFRSSCKSIHPGVNTKDMRTRFRINRNQSQGDRLVCFIVTFYA